MKLRTSAILLVLFFLLTGCATTQTEFKSVNTKELHNKTSQETPKIAVVPFTDRTTKKNSHKRSIDNPASKLTNKYLEVTWKKNEVRIAKADELLSAMKAHDLKYDEVNPPMSDLPKPNLEKIDGFGESLNSDLVYLGSVRKNNFNAVSDFWVCGLLVCFGDPIIPETYEMALQVAVYDVQADTVIAYDYINNSVKVSGSWFRTKEKKDEKYFHKAEKRLLELIAFSVAFPRPVEQEDLEKHFGAEEFLLVAGSDLLNQIVGTNVSDVKIGIKDTTWKTYPDGYFEENYKISKQAYNQFRKGEL